MSTESSFGRALRTGGSRVPARPDYDYLSRLDLWPLASACDWISGVDAPAEKIAGQGGPQSAGGRRILTLALASIDAATLRAVEEQGDDMFGNALRVLMVSPATFLAWALAKGLPLPDKLRLQRGATAPTERPCRWSDVTIRFKDGHTVLVTRPGAATRAVSMEQMGMADARTGGQGMTRPWRALLAFADGRGFVQRGAQMGDGERPLNKDDVKALRRALRQCSTFSDCAGDPIPPGQRGWQAEFTCLPESAGPVRRIDPQTGEEFPSERSEETAADEG